MQKLAALCIRRPVFATMLILALVVVGLDAYRKLGVDYFPKVEFPFVTITTTLRGASPEEIESQVTKPLEEVLNTIAGIDDLNSSSFEGISIITIGFVLEKDPEIAAQEVRDKISTISGQLPKDADPPIVEKIATDAAPVLNIVISASRDLREVTKLVDDNLKKNLESLDGVGQVRWVGDRTRQIQVVLDGEKLYSYNLNVEQVRAALALQNIEIPGGRIDAGNREVSLRTLGRVQKPLDFARIVVGNVSGAPVRVADIADVVDGVEEPRSLARLDGKPAVVLAIRKQAGTNTLDVIARVKDRVNQLKTTLPPDFQITYARDQSGFIQAAFNAVQEHLVLGAIFASIIVLLFIRSWRSTLIAAIAIPTSIISTFSLLQYMGFTLNQITMLALTLVVGIVIDDAIVVLENIFKWIDEKGMDPMTAAVQGAKEIGLAVTATTLSLIIIFIPIAVMPGIIGKFMSSFGYTAAFAIGVSLLVSFTLTPMLCSRFLKRSTNGESQATTKETVIFRAFAVPYRALLRWSMTHRWAVVVLAVLVVYSIKPMMAHIGIDFLPIEDQSEFDITVRAPIGSSLEGTESLMAQIEQDVRALPGVRAMLTTVGADVRRQVDRGSITVELVDVKDRKVTQRQIMDMARDRLRKYNDVVFGVQMPNLISGSVDREFMYSIQGPDLAKLDEYSKQLMGKLKTMPGVFDLDSSYESGKPEVRVIINRDKAADLNVNVASVANAMRVLVGGDDQVTTYKEGDDRYDVSLRVRKEFRSSSHALERLYIPSTALGNVPISSVASLERGSGPTSIDRYNRQRRIMLSGNLSKGAALKDVLDGVDREITAMNMPPEYRSGAVGRSKELGRSIRNYAIALLLSIIFMYMILAATYESFIDPVTILLSLPLSVPFALLSLLLARENFSIVYTSLGILVLFGIVKKNSILQIDHIKQLRRDGMKRFEAVMKGCEDRLRPILMTTAALIAGMLPLAFGSGAGAGTRRTVAIVVIGGQSLALLLTLLVTPVAYTLFDDVAHLTFFGKLSQWYRSRSSRMKQGVTGLIIVVLLFSSMPVEAQKVDQAPRVGVSITERKLTIDEAIQLSLKNNLDIEIERTNIDFARRAIQAAQGAFDANLRITPLAQLLNNPAASVLVAPSGKLTEKSFLPNVNVSQRTPWQGLSLHLDWLNGYQSTTNPFQGLTPYYTSSLNLGVSLPLLRGRTIDPTRAEIRIRQKNLDLSESDFEVRVTDIVTRTQNSYWDLVAARQDVDVKDDGVQLSREQLARNQRMIASGTLAPVELAASEAELQRRIDDYLAAVAVVTAAENALKLLLTPDRTDPLWSDRIVPTTAGQFEAPKTDLREAMDTALKLRPELRSIDIRKDANDVSVELARDTVKPQINLVAGYVNAGLAGTINTAPNPISAATQASTDRLNQLSVMAGLPPLPSGSFGGVPSYFVGGYGQALSNLFGGGFQSVQAGLQFDITPRNRTAQANLAQTLINERRIKLLRRQTEQAIEAQVRTALQQLESTQQRIVAAQSGEKASQEKLNSEVRLFQTGESTNFLVLTRQNELLDSRRRVIVATLEFNRAVSRLEQVVGRTLPAHNISLK